MRLMARRIRQSNGFCAESDSSSLHDRVRQGVNRSMIEIIRSERNCSCVEFAAGSSSIAAARSIESLRIRGETSPPGLSKKPDAPLAPQLGRKFFSQVGSI